MLDTRLKHFVQPALVGSIVALALAAAPARAEEVTLKFATLSAPTMHLNARVFEPWKERINEQGKGVLQVEPVYGMALANFGNAYDRVLSDVVQVNWHLQSYIGGKFPLTDVTTLPFAVDNAEVASIALWRLYEKGVLGKEYGDIKPIMLIVFPQPSIHLAKKQITKIEDLAGVKIRVSGKVSSQVVQALGGAPISMPASDMYPGIQRGTIDGTLTPWTAFQPYKLAEVTTFHLELPLGANPGMVYMAKKKYDALPAAARAIIDKNSGVKESTIFGQFWDDVQSEARAQIAASKDHTIHVVPPQEAEMWKKKVAGVTETWISETPGGAGVYKAWLAEIESAKAGK